MRYTPTCLQTGRRSLLKTPGSRLARALSSPGLRRLLSLLLSLQLCLPSQLPAAADDQVETQRQQSTLWVLSIGVGDYADERLNLEHADRDAAKIAQVFAAQEGRLFRQVQSRLLVNAQATRAQILRALKQFLGQARASDVVLIFLAGHGAQDRQTGTYYFVPHDARADNLYHAGLGLPMLAETCRRLQGQVQQVVLLLDTGRPTAEPAAMRTLNAGKDLALALPRDAGLYWSSAHKAGEASQSGAAFKFKGEKHGAFTHSLLRGLQGKAADEGGVVWLGDLFAHVGLEVPQATGSRQHPHWHFDGRDLPLFITDDAVKQLMGKSVSIDAYGDSQPQPYKEKTGSGSTLLWLLLVGAAAAGGILIAGSSDDGGPTVPDPTVIPPPPALPDE